MKELHEKYGDRVDFYTLYIRENHPTRKYQAHQSFEQKVQVAKELRALEKIPYPFLIDSIEGDLHQKLGNYGNAIYVVGTDGYVNHFSLYPNKDFIAQALDELLKNNGQAKKSKIVPSDLSYPPKRLTYSEYKKFRKKMHDRIGDELKAAGQKDLKKVIKKFEAARM